MARASSPPLSANKPGRKETGKFQRFLEFLTNKKLDNCWYVTDFTGDYMHSSELTEVLSLKAV